MAAATLSLFLISLFAMALSTMNSLFSAGLCAIRYDIIPACWPELISGGAHASEEATATRRSVVAGVGIYAAMVTVFYGADAYFHVSLIKRIFSAGIRGLLFPTLLCAPRVGTAPSAERVKD